MLSSTIKYTSFLGDRLYTRAHKKISFCARVVNIWNSLPNEVAEANTIDAFKCRLDKHWSNQDVLFDFNADLTGTGSVPICM